MREAQRSGGSLGAKRCKKEALESQLGHIHVVIIVIVIAIVIVIVIVILVVL